MKKPNPLCQPPPGHLLLFAVFSVCAFTWLLSISSKALWTDEVFSAWVCGTGNLSLGETWKALNDGRDGMMPLFYLVGNLWNGLGTPPSGSWFEWQDRLLPHSHELWMRLPSLLWAFAGLIPLSAVLARRYGHLPVAAGLALMMFGSRAAGVEIQWFRAYGMMFGLSSMYLALLGSRINPLSVRGWFFSAVVQSALVLAHPYGIFFALAPLLPEFLFTSKSSLRRSLAISSSSLPAIGMFAASLPQLMRFRGMVGEMGQWDPPPLDGLVNAVLSVNPTYFAWSFLVPGLLALVAMCRPNPAVVQLSPRSVESAALSFLALPFVFWSYAQWDPVFHPRYFTPNILGIFVAFTAVWSRLASDCRAKTVITWIFVLAVCAAQIRAVAGRPPSTKTSMSLRGELDPEKLALTPSEMWRMPVVVDDVDQFLPRAYYNPDADYRFLIDEDAVYDPAAKDSKTTNLITQLLLAHEKTAKETSGRAGLPSRHLLRRSQWKETLESESAIAVVLTGKTALAKDFEKELLSAGWTPTQGAAPGHRVWRKPRSR